jgi:hypothetical protein
MKSGAVSIGTSSSLGTAVTLLCGTQTQLSAGCCSAVSREYLCTRARAFPVLVIIDLAVLTLVDLYLLRYCA